MWHKRGNKGGVSRWRDDDQSVGIWAGEENINVMKCILNPLVFNK
jgi:hypothetical protein